MGPSSASSVSASKNPIAGRTACRARQRFGSGSPTGGQRPASWFTKFSGVIHDERWLKPVEQIYQRLASWEKYLRNEDSLARVGMVYSQQTSWFHGGRVEEHTLGWYQALIEARIPFEMVHDRLLDAAHLAPLKTLILPNIAALSDAQCRQIREFVERGGSAVATHETSLCDEWGVRRKDFGLADLFGVTFKGRGEGPMQNSYLRLETDPATGQRHMLAGLERCAAHHQRVRRIEVEATRRIPQPAADSDPSSRSPHGEGLSSGVEDGSAAGLPPRSGPRTGCVFPLGH